MTERIRTTISVDPEVYEIFKRMAAAANQSVSRTMGDWLTDTADAATMITTKMEEAKSAPVRVMRELQAMVAGMGKEVDEITEVVRGKRRAERGVRHAQRGAVAGSASVPPSSNTGGKSPNTPTPKVGKGTRK
jgi:predicted CopG family antitoxin